ncbi:MAG: hypothetical protein JRJ58_04650 [Deltaproteobacteria bacterium]|nr:hypothetical protein [Deltaproteobacteria bacterium]
MAPKQLCSTVTENVSARADDFGVVSRHSVLVENVGAEDPNLGKGIIWVGRASKDDIAKSSAIDPGIDASASTLTNNIVTGGFIGMRCYDCTLIGNTAKVNLGFGLDDCGSSSDYSRNPFDENNGGNSNPPNR